MCNLYGLCNADGHPFIQCSIPVQSHNTKELALIHSGHSAQAINKFLASLDLKGEYCARICEIFSLFSIDSFFCFVKNQYCASLIGLRENIQPIIP